MAVRSFKRLTFVIILLTFFGAVLSKPVVQSVTSDLCSTVTYIGPNGTALRPTDTPTTRPSPTPTPTPTPIPSASACSYWLEEIPHHGVSAFNPDPNYTVFRNVKDYGAAGMITLSRWEGSQSLTLR